MERYICIHGHFYQPPRENAWLEAVEVQDSAYPYHDWNERITVESYAPNATSRILDGERWITRILNNYARISFNVRPTLLEWIQVHSPDLYSGLLAADRDSQRSFSGHGSAIAQAYNHMIMPLANRRDKITQVVWGIRDFESRFGRRPEACGCPRRPWTSRRSTSSPSTASTLPSSHRTRPGARARSAAAPGTTSGPAASTPRWPTARVACHPDSPSTSSSTTARSRAG